MILIECLLKNNHLLYTSKYRDDQPHSLNFINLFLSYKVLVSTDKQVATLVEQVSVI